MKIKLIRIPINTEKGDEIIINEIRYTVTDSFKSVCSETVNYELSRKKNKNVTQYVILGIVIPIKERRLVRLTNTNETEERYVITSLQKRKDKYLLICEEVLL